MNAVQSFSSSFGLMPTTKPVERRKVELRPYQSETIQGVRYEFSCGNKRVLLVAPTGAGKTVMFSYLAQATLAKNLDSKTLILTDRKELLTQAGGTLQKFGIVSESIKAGRKANHRARCFVGMVETYYNRLKKVIEVGTPNQIKESYLTNFNLVIIDEAHKGPFAKVFRLWDAIGYTPYTIGATATPISAKKDIPLSTYYNSLVNRVQIPELVELGFLSPCITYAAKIDRSKLKRDGMGEYSDASQMDAFATRTVYDGLLQRYQEVCTRYNDGKPLKSIAFNINVEHSKQVAQMFVEAGYRCAHVDGTTPEAERDRLIKAYQRNDLDIICNVGILNAGFDDPDTRCILFNRATTSVSLWLQSCGRGSRIFPGKENFVILDMGGNWLELGLWDAEREWGELWNQKAKKSDKLGVAPVKECPQCAALVKLSASECSECNYVFPIKEKKFAEAEEFVEVTSDMVPAGLGLTDEQKEILKLNRRDLLPTLSVEVLLQIQAIKGYKAGWIIWIINDRAKTSEEFYADIDQIAAIRNYKQGWVDRQEWKPKAVPIEPVDVW